MSSEPWSIDYSNAIAVKVNGNRRECVAARQCDRLRQWRDEKGATNWAQLGFLHVRTKFSDDDLSRSHDPFPSAIILKAFVREDMA